MSSRWVRVRVSRWVVITADGCLVECLAEGVAGAKELPSGSKGEPARMTPWNQN